MLIRVHYMTKELDWVRQALHDRMPSRVAEKTGLSVATVTAIKNGRNTNPTIGTLNALVAYLVGDGE
jgi:transcriptional regulator with XRE-family HTH domain